MLYQGLFLLTALRVTFHLLLAISCIEGVVFNMKLFLDLVCPVKACANFLPTEAK